MLLLIGWRGEPGAQDEPQHLKQGRIQLDLLKIMDIPFKIISQDDDIEKEIDESVRAALLKKQPVAIIIKKGTFANYKSLSPTINQNLISREESLKIILNQLLLKTE